MQKFKKKKQRNTLSNSHFKKLCFKKMKKPTQIHQLGAKIKHRKLLCKRQLEPLVKQNKIQVKTILNLNFFRIKSIFLKQSS